RAFAGACDGFLDRVACGGDCGIITCVRQRERREQAPVQRGQPGGGRRIVRVCYCRVGTTSRAGRGLVRLAERVDAALELGLRAPQVVGAFGRLARKLFGSRARFVERPSSRHLCRRLDRVDLDGGRARVLFQLELPPVESGQLELGLAAPTLGVPQVGAGLLVTRVRLRHGGRAAARGDAGVAAVVVEEGRGRGERGLEALE